MYKLRLDIHGEDWDAVMTAAEQFYADVQRGQAQGGKSIAAWGCGYSYTSIERPDPEPDPEPGMTTGDFVNQVVNGPNWNR